MRRHLLQLILLLAGASCLGFGQTPEDAFRKGNELYRAGRFHEAVTEYESIVHQGYVSAPLFFNLGNASYRSGDIAHAILWFERAARLDAGDPDIDFNLRLANTRIIDRIEPVPELFLLEWIRALSTMTSLPTTIVLLLVAWLLVFVQLAVINLIGSSSWNAVFRWGILAALVFVLIFGAVFAVQMHEAADRSEAVIVAKSVTAKNSPDAQSVDAFVIHEGLKVKVSDSIGDWARITLADGKVGWIKSEELENI